MDDGGRRTALDRDMREDSRARREKVLATAAEVIRERGLVETRISDIGERAGMSAGHVMYYFASKDDLLREAVRWSEDRFYEEIASDLATVEDPGDRLFRLIERWCPVGDERESTAWVLWPDVLARAIHDRELAALRAELDGRWMDYIEALVKQARPNDGNGAKNGRALDPRLFAHMLGALLDGLAQRVLSGDPEISPEVMRDACVRFAEGQLGRSWSASQRDRS